MSRSNQQDREISVPSKTTTNRLEKLMYLTATSVEKEILGALSEVIEAVRESLQALVKPVPQPRLGMSLDSEQPKNLIWEKILLRHSEPIFARLKEQGYKEAMVMKIVFVRCTLSNPDAILWMLTHYAMVESLTTLTVDVALDVRRGVTRDLSAKRVGAAAAKRRLEGDITRGKVKSLAEDRKSRMSRQKAANEIAKIVNIEPTRVMVILRELYPGGKNGWPWSLLNKT